MQSLQQIRVPSLWQLGLLGEHVRIGVVGTGVDLSHPDLKDKAIDGFSLLGDYSIKDNMGHETGIIWLITRIAPRAYIVVAKDRDGSYGSMANIIQACEKLRQLDVHVINLSVASDFPTDGTDPLSREVNYLVENGIVVVAAAGNRGPKLQTIGTPGSAEQALTVGKVTERDRVALDSSRGPTVDGRCKPDCVAPGAHVLAALPLNLHRGLYQYFGCTSYATPHATGLVALLKQAYVDAVPSVIKRAIMEGCDPLYSANRASETSRLSRRVAWRLGVGITPSGDTRWSVGSGRLNAYRSFEWLKRNGSS